jgi:hypothetical protein
MGDSGERVVRTMQKKSVRKAGRTVLVNSSSLGSYVGDDLVGLQSHTVRENNLFLTFDTIPNAVSAFKRLRTEHRDWRVKFSYYKVFFTMVGLSNTSDYNTAKQSLVNYVSTNSGSNVLYCKFYRKDNNFLGCGDLTVDTLDGMNHLLQKDGGCKEFSFDGLSGTFYRYRATNRDRTNSSSE